MLFMLLRGEAFATEGIKESSRELFVGGVADGIATQIKGISAAAPSEISSIGVKSPPRSSLVHVTSGAWTRLTTAAAMNEQPMIRPMVTGPNVAMTYAENMENRKARKTAKTHEAARCTSRRPISLDHTAEGDACGF